MNQNTKDYYEFVLKREIKRLSAELGEVQRDLLKLQAEPDVSAQPICENVDGAVTFWEYKTGFAGDKIMLGCTDEVVVSADGFLYVYDGEKYHVRVVSVHTA